MGMSTHIQGFVSPDDPTYKKHCKVLDVCLEAGVSLPDETAKYFGQKKPYEDMAEEKLEVNIEIVAHEWSGETAQGYEIIISELPKDVHKIRFCNSW